MNASTAALTTYDESWYLEHMDQVASMRQEAERLHEQADQVRAQANALKSEAQRAVQCTEVFEGHPISVQSDEISGTVKVRCLGRERKLGAKVYADAKNESVWRVYVDDFTFPTYDHRNIRGRLHGPDFTDRESALHEAKRWVTTTEEPLRWF